MHNIKFYEDDLSHTIVDFHFIFRSSLGTLANKSFVHLSR